MYDTKVERVSVKTLNLDDECLYDLLSGKGIIIDSAEAYDAKRERSIMDFSQSSGVLTLAMRMPSRSAIPASATSILVRPM